MRESHLASPLSECVLAHPPTMGGSASREVFGTDLAEQWRRRQDVPLVVVRCTSHIEQKAAGEPNLYLTPTCTSLDGSRTAEVRPRSLLTASHTLISAICAQDKKNALRNVVFRRRNKEIMQARKSINAGKVRAPPEARAVRSVPILRILVWVLRSRRRRWIWITCRTCTWRPAW